MSAAAGDEDDEDDAVGFLEVTAGWQEPPWREAALFLQSIPGDIISPESIVSSQKKVGAGGRPSLVQPYDLEMALRDGTVLCRTIAALSKEPVEYVEKPRSQAHMLKNIQAFIDAALLQLQVQANFTSSEFFKGIEAGAICTFIDDLSHSLAAMDLGLDTLAELSKPFNAIKETIDYDIACHDCMSYSTADATEGQGGGGGDAEYQTSADPNDKRNRVLGELLETEQQYGAALRLIAEQFQAPMASGGVVSEDDASTLFGDIDALYQAHVGFLAALEKEMGATSGRLVSKCLLNAIEPFRCYALFCCQLPNAMAKYDELFANAATKAVLEKCRVESGQAFSLRELLNTPMQRILKYPLLLKQLFRGTAVSHEDKPGLGKSVSAYVQMCTWINTTKTQYDAVVAQQLAVENYPADAPSWPELGFFCAEGDVYYASELKTPPSKHRAFLLDGALVLCQRGKTKKKLKHVATIDLRSTTAKVDLVGNGPGKKGPLSKGVGGGCALSLTVAGRSTHIVWFLADEDRARWVGVLGKCIANLAEEEYFGGSSVRRGCSLGTVGTGGAGDAGGGGGAAAGDDDSDSDSGPDEEGEDGLGVAVPYSQFTPKNLKVPITREFNKKKAYMMFTPKSKTKAGGGAGGK